MKRTSLNFKKFKSRLHVAIKMRGTLAKDIQNHVFIEIVQSKELMIFFSCRNETALLKGI